LFNEPKLKKTEGIEPWEKTLFLYS